MGPAVCLGPGVISMKEDYVQGAPLHLHTQNSYAGTRDNLRRRSYMPSTIVVAHGLLSPMPVYGRRFSAEDQRVKKWKHPLNFGRVQQSVHFRPQVDPKHAPNVP